MKSGLAGLAMLATFVACGSAATSARPNDATPPDPRSAALDTVPEPDPIRAGRAPGPGPYAPGVDVLDYRVELDLYRDTTRIRGSTRIRLVTTETGVRRAGFDLSGLAVDSVLTRLRAGGEARFVAREQYLDSIAAGRLIVPLPDDSGAGDTVAVSVFYRGTPDDGLIQNGTVHGEPAAFADNWPNRARFWFPSVDHPSDKATVTFTVRAPEEWQVIANGAALSAPTPVVSGATTDAEPDPVEEDPGARRTWRWETAVPIPTYTMVVGAAEFRTRTIGLAACGRAPLSPRRDGCIEVTTWLYPQDTARARPSFERSAEMVDFFTRTVGPFPYAKLANVQSATRFGGMENASAIFYSEGALAAGADIERTVAHEIAHQWFGDSVTESDWHHLWLSEGFATYFGALFFEDADGPAAFRDEMERNQRAYLASDVTDRPIVDEDEADLFGLLNANNYQKGAWVLHMLRGVLGDEAFFAGIQEFYRRHQHGTVLTGDFRSVMEEVSDRSLEQFFDQWLHSPGHPVIETDWIWDEQASAAEITIRQVQPASWPTFRLPAVVELDLGEGEVARQEVDIESREVRFSVPLDRAPESLIFDPDGWILEEETAP